MGYWWNNGWLTMVIMNGWWMVACMVDQGALASTSRQPCYPSAKHHVSCATAAAAIAGQMVNKKHNQFNAIMIQLSVLNRPHGRPSHATMPLKETHDDNSSLRLTKKDYHIHESQHTQPCCDVLVEIAEQYLLLVVSLNPKGGSLQRNTRLVCWDIFLCTPSLPLAPPSCST